MQVNFNSVYQKIDYTPGSDSETICKYSKKINSIIDSTSNQSILSQIDLNKLEKIKKNFLGMIDSANAVDSVGASDISKYIEIYTVATVILGDQEVLLHDLKKAQKLKDSQILESEVHKLHQFKEAELQRQVSELQALQQSHAIATQVDDFYANIWDLNPQAVEAITFMLKYVVPRLGRNSSTIIHILDACKAMAQKKSKDFHFSGVHYIGLDFDAGEGMDALEYFKAFFKKGGEVFKIIEEMKGWDACNDQLVSEYFDLFKKGEKTVTKYGCVYYLEGDMYYKGLQPLPIFNETIREHGRELEKICLKIQRNLETMGAMERMALLAIEESILKNCDPELWKLSSEEKEDLTFIVEAFHGCLGSRSAFILGNFIDASNAMASGLPRDFRFSKMRLTGINGYKKKSINAFEFFELYINEDKQLLASINEMLTYRSLLDSDWQDRVDRFNRGETVLEHSFVATEATFYFYKGAQKIPKLSATTREYGEKLQKIYLKFKNNIEQMKKI